MIPQKGHAFSYIVTEQGRRQSGVIKNAGQWCQKHIHLCLNYKSDISLYPCIFISKLEKYIKNTYETNCMESIVKL